MKYSGIVSEKWGSSMAKLTEIFASNVFSENNEGKAAQGDLY